MDTPPTQPDAAVERPARIVRRGGLSPLERSILVAVTYADVFDYPLTEGELYERLVLQKADRQRFRRALRRLTGTHLVRFHDHVCLLGREPTVPARHRRQAFSERRWRWTVRYANWLHRIPFVRMVAASGSQAAGNAAEHSDVDLFCIVNQNRLWLSRLFIVPLSRLSRLLPFRMCPNYILAEDALYIGEHNLYTAHEVMQVMPVHGPAAYQAFLSANAWARFYLPHGTTVGRRRYLQSERSFLSKWIFEWLMAGPAGDALNRRAYHAFVSFCRRRAGRNGWDWSALQPAYQINRYTVPEGGYAHVIRTIFSRRLESVLGVGPARAELSRLFRVNGRLSPRCYPWDRLFAADYESARTNGHNGAPHE